MNDLALRPLNGLALCAGHGGLELGMHIVAPEYQTVCYVEREAYAAASIVARMEDAALDIAPVWDCVKTFDGRPWRGKVDIITGGYPCQGESTAGKMRGNKDPRWLWPDFKRIIGEAEPAECFFENVANHLNIGFYEVTQDLRSLGFTVAAGLFSAKETGASHERLRLFILAHRIGDERPRQRIHSRSRAEGTGASDLDGSGQELAHSEGGGRGKRGDASQPRRGGHIDRSNQNVGNADGRNKQRQWPGKPDARQPLTRSGGNMADAESIDRRGKLETGEQAEHGRRRLAGSGEGLPLFAPGPGNFDGWRRALGAAPFLEPAVCRMANGVAYRVDRLRGCGNGVSPLAAAYAYTTLSAAMLEYTGAGTTDGASLSA